MATLALFFCVILALLWLAVLKFFPQLHSGLVLVLGIAYLAVFGWAVSARAWLPEQQGLIPAIGTLVLWFLSGRGRLSPLLAGPRGFLGGCLPLLRGGLLLGLAVPGALRPLGAEALLGMLCLWLVSAEGVRRFWRRVGLFSLPGGWAFLAWLCVGAGWWYVRGDWLGAALSLTLLRCSPTLKVDPDLTPSRATAIMKMPMVTMNALLELVPAATLASWFRPDPFRLHLREPLMEAQNAPAYFAALAAHLNAIYGEHIETDRQLADFCVRYPESAARGVLSMPAVDPVKPGAEFQAGDLGALRKPTKVTQLAHLVRLRKIK